MANSLRPVEKRAFVRGGRESVLSSYLLTIQYGLVKLDA